MPRYNFQPLIKAGISLDDAQALRRISMTLHRWHEMECNGEVQRAEESDNGRPYSVWQNGAGGTTSSSWPIPDRERGALKRLAAIMTHYPTLGFYVQGDPRGAALYILRAGDIPSGADPSAHYSRGIAVYR